MPEEKIPCIKDYRGKKTLIVNGEPFIILGGEIHNSSASDLEYMEQEVWPNLRGLHMNSVVLPVYWETIEPTDGVFDFTLLDGIIRQARQEKMKLVLLWFGLWKNAESMYVPGWMKKDTETYYRACDYTGAPLNTISPLCEAAVDRDRQAFERLMEHLREVDQEEQTVIMVQVENEIGLLGTDRDYSEAAQTVFSGVIPEEVAAEFDIKGTWQEAFGTDAGEYFMAWAFASAVEKIARAGKAKYPLPLYVNAWLEQFPWRAGAYPSGGPVMKMQQMWKLTAPAIEFLAPDIYVPYVPKVMDEYAAADNPLFIPETRKDAVAAAYALYAVGGCDAIGFAPFGIEELRMDPEKIHKVPMAVMMALNIDPSAFDIEGSADYLAKSYEIIESIKPLYYELRGTEKLQSFVRKNSEELGTILQFEGYDIQVNYARKERHKPEAAGIVIQVSEHEFYMIGTMYKFTFLPKLGEQVKVDYVYAEEGAFADGSWKKGRNLNGDEKMHLELKDHPDILKVCVYKY